MSVAGCGAFGDTHPSVRRCPGSDPWRWSTSLCWLQPSACKHTVRCMFAQKHAESQFCRILKCSNERCEKDIEVILGESTKEPSANFPLGTHGELNVLCSHHIIVSKVSNCSHHHREPRAETDCFPKENDSCEHWASYTLVSCAMHGISRTSGPRTPTYMVQLVIVFLSLVQFCRQ